jgi:hypothetical protein
MTKRKQKEKQAEKASTNGWDVLIHLIDTCYKLTSSGNIFGAAFLLGFALVGFLAWKMPTENINTYILGIFNFIKSEKYYFFPLSLTILFSGYVNFEQARISKREIKRLVSVRTMLIHGIKGKEMEHLEEHSTSKYDIDKED